MIISDVKNQVLEYLNSSKGTGYGSFDLNPNYKLEAINDAIVDADYQVAVAIAATAGHSHRARYSNLVTMVNTVPLSWLPVPEADSDPEGIMILLTDGDQFPGVFAPSDKIKVWSGNPEMYGGLDVIEGYYSINSNMIIFIGNEISFTQFKVPILDRTTLSDTTLLNTPDVYTATVVKLTAAWFLSKLEDYMGAAGYCEQLGRTDIQNIKADKYFIPQSLMAQRQE